MEKNASALSAHILQYILTIPHEITIISNLFTQEPGYPASTARILYQSLAIGRLAS